MSFLKNLTNPIKALSNSQPGNQQSQPVYNNRPKQQFELIDPGKAYKADLFSLNALEFINDVGAGNEYHYSERQMLNAYLTSVYMYAALRRVANLISRVNIVAEVQESGRWVRAPEDVRINRIFKQEGSEILSRMWLNYAVYGAAVVYKVPTRLAALQKHGGVPITDYKEGAVAGLHVLDKPMWNIDEDTYYNELKGIYVNQFNHVNHYVGDKNFLDREEFVYVTSWNPENPNKGKSLVSVAIHEAVSNAAIAQWMSEYFTRGAMPFILVSMEDDPALITDSDLRKYKRQFEEYWQGLGSSLRSVFFDRQVKTEQVGIPAGDVAAPELNETALQGISSVVGLDRKLIVTADGGSYAEHVQLKKRAWEDTVIPLAKQFLEAFNRDLGFDQNMRLTLDLSDIKELDADREERSSTEISVYESSLQSYNEARVRLDTAPIPGMDGVFSVSGETVTIDEWAKSAKLPVQRTIDFADFLWNNNLSTRNEVLGLLGRDPYPDNVINGFKDEVEGFKGYITDLWGEDLLTRNQVLQYLSLPVRSSEDGYRSELERGADYGEWVTQLWSDNLLTRSQTLELLDMDLSLPEGAPDGYQEEIGDRKSLVMDLWGDNLMTRSEAMQRLGSKMPPDMFDGFINDLEAEAEQRAEKPQRIIDNVLEFWGENLLTKETVIDMLGLPKPPGMINGYQSEIEATEEKIQQAEQNRKDFLVNMWGENLITKRQLTDMLGLPMDSDAVDGYQYEVETIGEALAEKEANELTADPEENDDNSFRSMTSRPELAVAASEEDFLDGYGDYNFDTLNPQYGDIVDTMDEEVLPVAESYEEPFSNEFFDIQYDQPFVEVPATTSSKEDLVIKSLEEKALTAWKTAQKQLNPDSSLYVSLWFGYDRKIVDAQRLISSVANPEDVRSLQNPETFHITLVYAKDVSDDLTDRIIQNSISKISTFFVETDGFGKFANENEDVVYLNVKRDQKLIDLQQNIAVSFMSQGIEISKYSDPASYNPHITMFYANNGVELSNYLPKLKLRPVALMWGRDNYEMYHSVPIYGLDDILGDHDEPDGTKSAEMSFKSVKPTVPTIRELTIRRQENEFNKYINGFTDKKPGYLLREKNLNINNKNVIDKIKSGYYISKGKLASQSDARSELITWKKATLKRGIKKGLRFEAKHIDEDLVERIKRDLADIGQNNPEEIKSIFDVAFARLN